MALARWPWGRRGPRRRLLLLTALPLFTALTALPSLASSLGAWRTSPQGGLELRTSPDVAPQAFFQAGGALRGPRVWIDLPGAPSRSRAIAGSGALREVRVGRPDDQTTRLVLEFAPGTVLSPQSLRLVGTARDRWRMEFPGLAAAAIPSLGEGDLDAVVWRRPQPQPQPQPDDRAPFPTAGGPLSPDGLPVVPRGRFRVVIDPGHGGPDPGAVGIGGLRETDVVLDVSLQLARLLQARGVEVVLTRTSEVDVDLPPRVALANASNADAFVSIHANALSLDRPDVNGIESFYFEGGSSRSRALAAALQQQMLAISPGSPDRGVRTARFFVIRRTVMPSTLVEMGFVTGSLDSRRLADPGFRRRMALALAAGMLTYLQGQP